jgi:hypothetical protein
MPQNEITTTTVTRTRETRGTGEYPIMSYTAVTSHQAMAEAFIKELLRVGQRIMPDKELTIEDILAICHLALDHGERGAMILEGRHLRFRIADQISRAERYKETVSLLVLKLDDITHMSIYDSIVDTLCERMRKTDLLFLFRQRIALLLPHTDLISCQKLHERVELLLNTTLEKNQNVGIATLTYPSPDIGKGTQVLDWVEDQLRT